MAGCLHNVLEPRRFDFGFLGSNGSQSITLAPLIESRDYVFVAIYARVHQRNMSAGQSLAFELFNTLPCDSDNREFVEKDATGAASPLLTVTLTSSSPFGVPGISFGSASSPGPYLKLIITATQASAPTTFYIEASAIVLMRETR